MAGRDGEDAKEGVDFEWVKSPNSNAKTRRFFSKAEKAERAKPKAAAPKAEAPKAKPKAKAMDTTRPKARQKGRGDGMIEATRRGVESAFGTGPKQTRVEKKPEAMTTSPTMANMAPGPRLKASPGGTAKSGAARSTAGKVKKDVTYAEWQGMSRAQREKAGLPVSDLGGQLGFKRFMTGITGKESTMKRK